MKNLDTSEGKNQTPAKSWVRRLPWILIGLVIIADVAYLASPKVSDFYQQWMDQREVAYASRMKVRQQVLEAMLKDLNLPVFGPWEQVAPMLPSLAEVQEPERNPAPGLSYALWKEGVGRWQPMPQYLDGYSNVLRVKSIDPRLIELHPTVCLARTIVAKEAMTIPAYLAADGGFVVWLNGESLLLSDTSTEAMNPGQEIVQLTLRPGENRLVLKIRLDCQPCQFIFQPDYGEERTDQLLTDLEHNFPTTQQRASGYRRRAMVSATAVEDQYYQLTEIPVPDSIFLEGGALRFLPTGQLAVGTRRGFIYVVDGVLKEDPTHATFTKYASGLHEVLGMNVNEAGGLDVAQRGSLIRLKDRDQDGEMDSFQNLNNEWGLSGNYHEYTLDLERDSQGNYYTALSLSDIGGGTNVSLASWRGWIVQISADKKFVPWCLGFRCVNGLGWNAAGDLFATDNQGQWVAASPLYHVQRDHYYGSPASRASLNISGTPEARRRVELPPTPPAVWLPYEEFCMSATDIVCDQTSNQFGPFETQLFIGDMMKGTIVRVSLEKINGEYQGACFLFRRGVGAVNRMTFGPDNRLYLTRASRGWGGGGRGEGLARLEFTGEIPLEIQSMRLLPDGFELHLTLPLAKNTESELGATQIEQFRYEYWERYGSPKIDRELLPILKTRISEDRRRLTMIVNGIKAGRICHIVLPRISAATGHVLLHPDAFYTVNHLNSLAEIRTVGRQ